MKSNSNLLNYISLLMHDDDALKTFLVDPITDAEGKHGITKAERAVLRRTVSHLSNKSKNGYTVSRHLGSYRRSLRLLQNVLHNVGSKMVQDIMPSNEDGSDIVLLYYTVIFYYPSKITQNTDLTGKTNSYVDSNYGDPYSANTVAYTVYLANGYPTIAEVMDAVKQTYPDSPDFDTVQIQGDPYIKSVTVNDNQITADLSTYDLSDDYVFWFYSIDGKANINNSGKAGQSFADFNMSPYTTVAWQLIAPDSQYGFNPCDTTDGAEYNK